MNAAVLPGTNDIVISDETSSLLELTETASLLAREWDYTWTSTCGVIHNTNFPSNWNGQQIAQ